LAFLLNIIWGKREGKLKKIFYKFLLISSKEEGKKIKNPAK